MLGREHLAGAAEAVDDLVHDQQHAVLVADLAQPLPVFRRRDVQTIRGRNRLTDDGRDRLRSLIDDFLLDIIGAHDVARFALKTEVVPIVVRRRSVIDTVHERAEVGLVAHGGEAQRAHRHAVVAATARDDLVALREATHGLDLLGDLDRALNRLGATGAEVDAIQIAGCERRELIRQLDGRHGRV